MTSFASHETSTFLKISLQYVGTHFINPAIMTWLGLFPLWGVWSQLVYTMFLLGWFDKARPNDSTSRRFPAPDVSAEKNVNMKTAASVDSSSACRTKKAQSLPNNRTPPCLIWSTERGSNFMCKLFKATPPNISWINVHSRTRLSLQRAQFSLQAKISTA